MHYALCFGFAFHHLPAHFTCNSRVGSWRCRLSIRAFESEETKAKRIELKRQKDLRAITERISAYARAVHKQFPTGDVVVSERDLAEQLRKRTDVVVTALNLLLNEQKVQRAPLSGYWKLNT